MNSFLDDLANHLTGQAARHRLLFDHAHMCLFKEQNKKSHNSLLSDWCYEVVGK